MLVRHHLFVRLNAHTGDGPDPLSEACMRDAIMAVASVHPRLLRCHASLCKAKRADLSADFDVRIKVADMTALTHALPGQ